MGTSFSYGLLTEAVKRVLKGIFVHLDSRSLPFVPESFDAVYADALTYIPSSDLKDALRDYKIFLREKGVLYLSLRIGKESVCNERFGWFTLYDFISKARDSGISKEHWL